MSDVSFVAVSDTYAANRNRNNYLTYVNSFVVSIDKEKVTRPEGATLFRSYEVPNDPFRNVSIVEAARATSAAPTYFKHIQINTPTGNKSFVYIYPEVTHR